MFKCPRVTSRIAVNLIRKTLQQNITGVYQLFSFSPPPPPPPSPPPVDVFIASYETPPGPPGLIIEMK